MLSSRVVDPVTIQKIDPVDSLAECRNAQSRRSKAESYRFPHGYHRSEANHARRLLFPQFSNWDFRFMAYRIDGSISKWSALLRTLVVTAMHPEKC